MEADNIIARYKRLDSKKSNFKVLYQEIGNYCHPNSADFNEKRSAGEKRNNTLSDQTAQMAIDLSSSSLIGLVANPASRWFHIEMSDEKLNRDAEVMAWCEEAGQITLNYFNEPDSNFYGSLKGALESTLCYGMPAIFFQETDDGRFDFKDVALSQIVVAENSRGRIDTVIREYKMTARQIMQEVENSDWDVHSDVVKMAEEKPDEEIDVLFMVAPRPKGKADAIDRTALPIGGWFVDKKHQHIMHETGYYEMPLPVARWFKVADEVYGRSPAMIALQDIKTQNVLMDMLMFGMEKKINPNVFLPNDGFVNKVDLSAGGVTYYDAEKGAPVFYSGDVDVNAGFTMGQYFINNIRSMFYVDQLQLAADANMTATEVLQRQDEKARLLAPAIGRIQTELLSPLVQRGVAILIRNGRIPQPPEKIQGAEFKVNYVSPIQRGQRALDAQNIIEAATIGSQLMAIDNKVSVDMDLRKSFGEIMDIKGVTGVMKRNEEEAKKMEAMMDNMAEVQAGLAAGEQAANIQSKVAQ